MPSSVQINGECCFSYFFKSYRYFFLSARNSISIIFPLPLVMPPVGNTANTVEGKKVMRVGLLTISDRVRCTVHLHASFLSYDPPLFSDSSSNPTIYMGPVTNVLSFSVATVCLFQASMGIYTDESGPEMKKMLESLSNSSKWPLEPLVVCSAVVPDDSGTALALVVFSSICLYPHPSFT